MTECLLCKEQIKEKGSFLRLFLLKEEGPSCCSTCYQKFEGIPEEHCPRCFRDGQSDLCTDCQKWEKEGNPVQHQSLFTYNEAMKNYFNQYKFQGDYVLRFVFAKAAKKAVKMFREHIIVPIPVSIEKFQARGFNQVQGILDAANLSYRNILEKKDTLAQSSKTREERLQTQQAFKIKNGVDLPDKILLVDDIYTTGKTLQLAKQILLEAGVKEILTFSIAR
ncbi:DNA utilization protein GntX [Streptococcus sanguinis]|uniref:ComF family protein n=1 Tax=Streptococcus TaxID=1301 RepID=UPI00065F6F8C|nr:MULTISPECIES: ComF family protein [Streptococcus]MDN5013441.1 ComF family protein [Streptococcus sp. SN3]RSI03835.1 DNA utilization protein GntX [Streptococcus sanguinis]